MRWNSWKQPEEGFLKLNWHAAINKGTQRMGVGIIARDHGGAVVAAMCTSRPYICDPATAEALAVWILAEFCCRFGFTHIVVEGDAMEIVLALQRADICRGRYGHFVEEAKHLLNQSLSWSVQHVRREANNVAHQLVQKAALRDEENIWLLNFSRFHSKSCIL